MLSLEKSKGDNEEEKDNFNSENISDNNQQRKIKYILNKHYNDLNFQKPLTASENNNVKQNFNLINDNFNVPYIKNNISSLKDSNIFDKLQNVKCPNVIDSQTLEFLTDLRKLYQKQNDEQEKKYKNISKEKDMDTKIADTYKDIYNETKEILDVRKFDYKDFFQDKFAKFGGVNVASAKSKQIVKGIIENVEKRKRIVGKIFGKFKLKEKVNFKILNIDTILNDE